MHYHEKNYPRPQLVRRGWMLLDGSWNFAFDDEEAGLPEKWMDGHDYQRKIEVPFTYETAKSGIADERLHNTVWYERTFSAVPAGKRVILHFEGSDFETTVWVNGRKAGSHRGGYSRFSFDITDLVISGENRLTVMASDSDDISQPRGKQRWMKDSFGCWYIQTTGIWKSVWLELVPKIYVKELKLTPNGKKKSLLVEASLSGICSPASEDLSLSAKVLFDKDVINTMSVRVTGSICRMEIPLDRPDLTEWGVHTWSPEHPDLYDLELALSGKGITDHVCSYFGLREISIDGDRVLLNGSPIYERLILDQGYWKDSHLTPPDEDALIADIDAVQSMGFNGVRKHQKTEDERFLYWADVKGLFVWSEMAAAYAFTDDAVSEFVREWMEIVRQNYSHPSIITWTPFNESWGIGEIRTDRRQQQFTEAVYHLTKSFDPYRPVITNDGWEHSVSDIITLHDYEEKGSVLEARYMENKEGILSGEYCHNRSKKAFAGGYSSHGQPVILSEYGGIAFFDGKGWGYGNKVEGEETFLKRFEDITDAIKHLPYVCGYCYTQVSDVQQEVNGLLTADRKFKISPEKIKKINEKQL